MDGTVAPLKAICDIAEEHKAIVLIDECHATAVFGKVSRPAESERPPLSCAHK